MKKFKVTLGLGRMADHHEKVYEIEAKDKHDAGSIARVKYYAEVEKEIGPKAPIFGKILTVSAVVEL